MTAQDPRNSEVDRRRYLAALSTLSLGAFAGCSGPFGDDAAQPDGSDNTDDGDRTDGNGTDDEETGNDETSDTGTTTEATEELVSHLAAGRYEEGTALFDEDVRGPGTAASLELVWIALTSTSGPFSELTAIEENSEDGLTTVDTTLSFERGSHAVQVFAEGDGPLIEFRTDDRYESPEYVDPDGFDEHERDIEGTDCTMPGLATVPAGEEDVPGVVLVHGSDPQNQADRDLASGGTETFRDIAEGLASMGVATLRYDRRTVSCPTTVPSLGYTLDTVSVDDALVAVENLRNVDGVDSDRIYVVGHGLGGMAAPRIAREDSNLAGFVALASPGRPFYESSLDQIEWIANVGEMENPPVRDLFESWRDDRERIVAGDYDADELLLSFPGEFWDSLAAYDHLDTARGLDIPQLFMQGDRDFRVSPTEDFGLLQDELGDSPETEFVSYESLDHHFLPGDGPSVPASVTVRNNVAEQAVADIADWIQE